MKPFLIACFTLALMHPTVIAKTTAGQTPQQKQQEKKKEKEKEKADREKRRTAVQDVLDAKDKNHDGSLTKDEYLAGEADAAAATATFDKFNKNKDRVLAKAEIADSLGL
jgi:Flp pilus assembly protein TadB